MSPNRLCPIPQGVSQASKKGDTYRRCKKHLRYMSPNPCRSPEGGHAPFLRKRCVSPFLGLLGRLTPPARQSAARPRTSRRTKFRWPGQARDRPFPRILTEKSPSCKAMSWLSPQDRAGLRNGDTYRKYMSPYPEAVRRGTRTGCIFVPPVHIPSATLPWAIRTFSTCPRAQGNPQQVRKGDMRRFSGNGACPRISR
jgi:hypothetical protein